MAAQCLLCGATLGDADGDNIQSKSWDESILRCALWKLLEYWGLLAKYQNDQNKGLALWQNMRDFCPDCIAVLEEIASIHYKVKALELLIQAKAEQLGRTVVEREQAEAAAGTLASTPQTDMMLSNNNVKMDPLGSNDAWVKLRASVSQKFLDGCFPNPKVVIWRLAITEPLKTDNPQSTLPPPASPEEMPRRILTRSSIQTSGTAVKVEFDTEFPEYSMDVDSSDSDSDYDMIPDGPDEAYDSSWSVEDDENDDNKSDKDKRNPALSRNKYCKKFLLSQKKGYLSCPLCDLRIKLRVVARVINPTPISGIKDAWRILIRHFLGRHFRIMKKDAVKADNDNDEYFYSCKFCDYRSGFKDDVSPKPPLRRYKLSYDARIKLAEHVMLLHMTELKAFLDLEKEKRPQEPGYDCPKCEYRSNILYDTNDAHRFAVQKAKSTARQDLNRHYQKSHLFNGENGLEPSKSEDGMFYYYACKLCDFLSKVKGKLVRINKYYARMALARHSIHYHEKRNWKTTHDKIAMTKKDRHSEPNAEDLETTPVAEKPLGIRGRLKINQCPQCNFEANFDSEEQVTKKKAKQMTKEILTKHFTEFHNPVQVDEISLSEETGDEYYGCSLCNFRSAVNFQDSETNEERIEARHVLSEHYIDEHYKKHGRVCSSKEDDTFQTIPCAEPECTYTIGFKYSKDTMIKSKNRRLALVKLAKHSIKVHDCPEENQKGIFNKLLINVEAQEGYKCYRCDFISMVEEVGEDRKKIARAQSTAFNKFLTHYILHVVPKDAKDPVSGRRFYRSVKFLDTELVSRLTCTLCKYKTSKPSHLKKPNNRQTHRCLLAAEMKRVMFTHYHSKHPGVKFPNFQMYVPKSEDKGNDDEIENSSSTSDSNGSIDEGTVEVSSSKQEAADVDVERNVDNTRSDNELSYITVEDFKPDVGRDDSESL